jgi:hypothetical protein
MSCSASDWQEEQALALAKVATSLLATGPRERATVLDVIAELESILQKSVKGIAAPQGMQYDPDTGELIASDAGVGPPRPSLRVPLRFNPDTGEPIKSRQ